MTEENKYKIEENPKIVNGFTDGTHEHLLRLFENNKLKNSGLCAYCNINESNINFYVQTPSYYRNKASKHYFLCSEKCKTNCIKEKTCKKCGYGCDLILMDDYSLCTDYPNDTSCYEKEISNKIKVECCFCLKTKNINYENKIKINTLVEMNVCDECMKVFDNIENVNKSYIGCVFGCETNIENLNHINTLENDNYKINICDKCCINYAKLCLYFKYK
jgi:hypothetical protein